jgi:phage baseplate assembly protein W
MNKIRKNLFKDLDLDFAPHPMTADVPQKTDAEAVKRAIRNLVMMNKYDKPFKPQIDARLTRLLFEPATPITAVVVRSNIIDILNRYEPRAKINDVIVLFNDDTNTFEVTVSFMLLNTRETSKVFVTIERLR